MFALIFILLFFGVAYLFWLYVAVYIAIFMLEVAAFILFVLIEFIKYLFKKDKQQAV